MEKSTLIYNPVFTDHRGTFAPLKITTDGNSRLKNKWLQSNVVFNPSPLTLRGLHYQEGEFAQAKLIKVISGSIIDFVIDLRPDSDTYNLISIYEMSNRNNELYVPRGYAHGYLTTEENTVVQYLVDNHYAPGSQKTIEWNNFEEIKNIVLETIKLYTKPFIYGYNDLSEETLIKKIIK